MSQEQKGLPVKSRELRVGNVVTYDDRPVVIDAVDIVAIRQCEVAQKEVRYMPVPLSPELLEGFGFKYGSTQGVVSFNEETKKDETTHFWELPIKESEVVDSFTFSIVKWGEQDYFTFGFQLLRRRIKYVHELQNLRYWLTGTEFSQSQI